VTLGGLLASGIQRLTYTPVEAADLRPERLSPHLRITFAVINERVRRSHARKTREPPAELKTRGREAVARVSASHRTPSNAPGSRLGLRRAAKVIDTRQGGTVIARYPALVDTGTSVSITP